MTSGQFVADLLTKLQTRWATGPYQNVETYLVPSEDMNYPVVVLLRGRVFSDVSRMAHRVPKREVVSVPGLIVTNAVEVDDASNLALNLVAEIDDELNTNPPAVGDVTLDAMVTRIGWIPVPSDRGGWDVSCEYDITYSSGLL